MRLNKATGNMSALLTHTGNCILGCQFHCKFCWAEAMAKRYDRPFIPQFRTKQLLKPIRQYGLRIGLNWNGDMWGPWVRKKWINRTLDYVAVNDHCTWYALTKFPHRYLEFQKQLPENLILGTTIETNYPTAGISEAPAPALRYHALRELSELGFLVFVIMEPIQFFDITQVVDWIQAIKPIAVEIGAVTGGYSLHEPTAHDLHALIRKLRELNNVILKPNLTRLYNEETYVSPLEAFL